MKLIKEISHETNFTTEEKHILLHGHCQQKAIASTEPSKKMLSLPQNYSVKEIPSGCCGMAGSFGYEKEHYDLSMKIGEMVLFPAVRSAEEKYIIFLLPEHPAGIISRMEPVKQRSIRWRCCMRHWFDKKTD